MERPNILLITTDQQRGDALGIENHPVVQTPYLDAMAKQGLYFRHAYSAHPQCIPARRTLMSGRAASNHGVFFNFHAPLEGPTLPGELTRHGYQTHLCGKLHLHPQRKLYGFMSADWADAPHAGTLGDYGRWLVEQGLSERDAEGHGAHVNGWVARPWHLPEKFHFTNWVTERALDFLERRDPTVPFFLNVSYFHPHQPCTPPQAYWDRYIDADIPPPIEADWSRKLDGPQPGTKVDSWQTALNKKQFQQWAAGYFACINHIDDQIGRLLRSVPRDTVVIFTSDHGEMLGDHQWIRKTRALEGSARVPFLLKLPESLGIQQGATRREVVELSDIMPTLLDLAGASVPDGLDGESLLPRLRGEGEWRERLHGEISQCGGEESGMQFLTDGKRKYIWEPGFGRELFFDLETDPREEKDLSREAQWQDVVNDWRQDLVERLEGRPEGFVKDGKLARLDGPTPPAAPELLDRGYALGKPMPKGMKV